MIPMPKWYQIFLVFSCLILTSCITWPQRPDTVQGPPVDITIIAGTTQRVTIDGVKFARTLRHRPQPVIVPGKSDSKYSNFIARTTPHGPESIGLLVEAKTDTLAGQYKGYITLSRGFWKPGLRVLVNIMVVPLRDPVSGQTIIPLRPSYPSSDRIVGGKNDPKYVGDELIVLLDVETPFDHIKAKGEICRPGSSCFVCPPPKKNRNAPVINEGGIACQIANQTGGVFLGSVPEARAYQMRFPGLKTPWELEKKRMEILLLSHEFPAITTVSRSFIGGPASAFPATLPSDYIPAHVPPETANTNQASFDAINAMDAWKKAVTTDATAIPPTILSPPIPGKSSVSTQPRIPVAVIDVDFRGAEQHQEFLDPAPSPSFDNVSFRSKTAYASLRDLFHGKIVAGLIGARGETGYSSDGIATTEDIAGMIWDVDLRLYDFQRGGSALAVNMLEAMVRAIDNKPLEVPPSPPPPDLNDTPICMNNLPCNDNLSIVSGTDSADLPHPRVINISYGFFDNSTPCSISQTPADETNAILGQGILYGMSQSKDILWVFAAGNKGKDAKCEAPAALSGKFPLNTMTVAAADATGATPIYWVGSAISGNKSNTGSFVTVAAPGAHLKTIGGTNVSTAANNTTYAVESGTSLAAPIVSGLAALILSQDPTQTARSVKQCIVQHATTKVTEPSGNLVPFIDASAAMADQQGNPCPPPSTIDLTNAPPLDVIFAFDTTGSMGGEISQVKANAGAILSAINTATGATSGGSCAVDSKVCYAVINYDDYPNPVPAPSPYNLSTYNSLICGPAVSTYDSAYGYASYGDEAFRVPLSLTADGSPAGSVVGAIASLQASGGADGPESYARAFWEIAEDASGRGSTPPIGFIAGRNSMKVIINFGDNVPHDTDLNGNDLPCQKFDTCWNTTTNVCPNPVYPFYKDCKCADTDEVCNRLAGLKVPDSPTLLSDTGFDPGRDNAISCGVDDIDFQENALKGLIENEVRLIHIDSSGDPTLIPYWSVWTQGTGGAFGRATTDGTPIVEGGSVTLPDFILQLLSSLPAP